ncbi:MAG: SMC-Scp complex subunit ScpB [Pseudomonadota bacterium]
MSDEGDGAAPDDAPAPDVVEALFDAPPLPELERMVEAILFASAEPLTRPQIEERLPHGSDASAAIESLRKRYQGRGVALMRIGPAWAFRTAPDLGHLMRRDAQETRRLSRAAIETLAIIAYHQPTTRAEIEEIRGVSVSRGTLDLLLELDWIKLGRRRETPGRPVTFVTTAAFLDHFGLESARDLPGIKELRAAGLLDNRPPPGEVLSLDDDDPAGTDDQDTEDMFAEEEGGRPV